MKILRLLLFFCVALLVVVLAVAGVNGGGASADQGPVLVTWGQPPKVAVEEQATPPEGLMIEDLKEGDGEEATDRDEVAVRYAAMKWNGQSSGSSWDAPKAKPFSFSLGASPPEVSPGWERGIDGMKEGGRRELIIPPDLLYLPGRAAQRALRPSETEIYVIELVDVEPR